MSQGDQNVKRSTKVVSFGVKNLEVSECGSGTYTYTTLELITRNYIFLSSPGNAGRVTQLKFLVFAFSFKCL